MQLPFTEDQFLDVLGAFNLATWPVLIALWIASAFVTAELLRGRPHSRTIGVLAVVHWGWSGLAYHALYFTQINPAAVVFAAAFAVQAALFIFYGVVRGPLVFEPRHSMRHVVADIFLVYALAYPALVLLTGPSLPRAPLFGVPCPTALFTTGLLLAMERPPRLLFVIPILWSLVGGSAAVLLGIVPDFMMLAGAAALAASAAVPRQWRGSPERTPI